LDVAAATAGGIPDRPFVFWARGNRARRRSLAAARPRTNGAARVLTQGKDRAPCAPRRIDRRQWIAKRVRSGMTEIRVPRLGVACGVVPPRRAPGACPRRPRDD